MSDASSMQAIVKTQHGTTLAAVARPPLTAGVRIRVARAGVCRTDLHVARGRLPCRPPRILGHELSGVVSELPADTQVLTVGDRVTVAPLLACQSCPECRAQRECRTPRMLGVDVDGAFAQELIVPLRAVHRVPATMSFERAAYVEPVAASLAVLHTELHPDHKGAILGSGRIAELTRRILVHRGFDVAASSASELADQPYDFIVDSVGSSESLAAAMHALRFGGTLILKSRPALPALLDVGLAVQRALTLRAVRYAPFEEAVALLDDARFHVEDLFGPSAALASFERVFADAEQEESSKLFFAPNPELG